MVSTPLVTFGNAEMNLRFQQPFLTQGINDKSNGVVADGIYRGFRLTTSGVAMSVTVEADQMFGDHVASLLSASGEQITLRRTGGFTVDLTAFASKTVVLGLVGDYTRGKATKATLRAFELSPSDEFTGAGDEVVPLGAVVVPASGTIAAASITARLRREAWQRKGSGEIAWMPILQNAGFERAVVGVTSATESKPAQAWFCSASDSFTMAVVETAANTGFRSMEFASPSAGTCNTGLIRQFTNVPVTGGKFLRLEAFVQQRQAVIAGAAHMKLEFVDKDSVVTDVLSRALDFAGVSTSFVRFQDAIQVPASAVLLRKVEIRIDDLQVAGAGAVFRFDDVQAWIETIGIDQPIPTQDSWARELATSNLQVIDPTGDIDQDAVSVSYDSVSPSLEGALNIDQVRDTLVSNTASPSLRFGGRLFDLGHRLLATAVNAVKARRNAKFSASFDFTLMDEYTPDSGPASGNSPKTYVKSDGSLVVVHNAIWLTGSSKWHQEDAARISTRVVFNETGMKMEEKAIGASDWIESAWTRNFNYVPGPDGVGFFSLFTDILVASNSAGVDFASGFCTFSNATATVTLANGLLALDAIARTLALETNAFTVDTVAKLAGFFADAVKVDGTNKGIVFDPTTPKTKNDALHNLLVTRNVPKAWASVDLTGPTLLDGANISGVTFSGNNLRLTFAQAMADSNYAVFVSYNADDVLGYFIPNTNFANLVDVGARLFSDNSIVNLSGAPAGTMFVLVFGTQS